MTASTRTRDLERQLRAARKADRATAPKRVIQKRAEPTADGQRKPRERDPGFLAYLRRCPCVAGLVELGCEGPVQAAHLRFSDASRGRINSGLQSKPSDRWATPLCAKHHLRDQHTGAERAFWERLGIEPGDLSMALYAAYVGDLPAEPILYGFAAKASQNLSDTREGSNEREAVGGRPNPKASQ